MRIGRPTEIGFPLLPLRCVVGRMRGPTEIGGAALTVVTDRAAELGQRMRAAGADEQVEPRMRTVGLRQFNRTHEGDRSMFSVSDFPGKWGVLAEKWTSPQTLQFSRVDPLMARRAAIEAGDLAELVVDRQFGKPDLLDGRRLGRQASHETKLTLIFVPRATTVGNHHPHRDRQERQRGGGKRDVHSREVVVGLVAGGHRSG